MRLHLSGGVASLKNDDGQKDLEHLKKNVILLIFYALTDTFSTLFWKIREYKMATTINKDFEDFLGYDFFFAQTRIKNMLL